MSKPKGAYSYSDEEIIKAIWKEQGLLDLAAQRLGCARQTIYSRIQASEAVREAAKAARELQTDLAEKVLFNAIAAGNLRATIFYLRTVGGDRGYTERTELTGANGAPLTGKGTSVVHIILPQEPSEIQGEK